MNGWIDCMASCCSVVRTLPRRRILQPLGDQSVETLQTPPPSPPQPPPRQTLTQDSQTPSPALGALRKHPVSARDARTSPIPLTIRLTPSPPRIPAAQPPPKRPGTDHLAQYTLPRDLGVPAILRSPLGHGRRSPGPRLPDPGVPSAHPARSLRLEAALASPWQRESILRREHTAPSAAPPTHPA